MFLSYFNRELLNVCMCRIQTEINVFLFREIVNNIPAGNIIGVGGLKGAYPGETISMGEIDSFEQITHIFEPVMTKAIEAKKPSDLPALKPSHF